MSQQATPLDQGTAPTVNGAPLSHPSPRFSTGQTLPEFMNAHFSPPQLHALMQSSPYLSPRLANMLPPLLPPTLADRPRPMLVNVPAWVNAIPDACFEDAVAKALAPRNRNARLPYMVAAMEDHLGDFRVFVRWDESRPGPDGTPALVSLAVVTPPQPSRKVFAEVVFASAEHGPSLPGHLMRFLLVHAAKLQTSVALHPEYTMIAGTTAPMFSIAWHWEGRPQARRLVVHEGAIILVG